MTSLQHPRDCWAFVVIMALTKKGLITPEAGLTPLLRPLLQGLLKTNQRGLASTIVRLKSVGLLDELGYPNGFEESQLSPEAIRKRRQRDRDKSQKSHDRGRKQKQKQNKDIKSGQPKWLTREIENQAKKSCSMLCELMVENDPKAKVPAYDLEKQMKWILDMARIYHLDKRSWGEIRGVIQWCQHDDFWRGNILSPAKLRKQFPQLLLKMNARPGRSRAQQRLQSNQGLLENFERRPDERNGKITGSNS